MDLIPNNAREWERLHQVNRRLAYLGLEQGIMNWHALVARCHADQTVNLVPADVDAMSDRQVIAFVRKHGHGNVAAMVYHWQMLDNHDESNDPDRDRMPIWRYTAFRIAGYPDDHHDEGSASWMADDRARLGR